MTTKDTISVSAIWLRSVGKQIEVLAEVAGEWRVIIDGYQGIQVDGSNLLISETVTAVGIRMSRAEAKASS